MNQLNQFKNATLQAMTQLLLLVSEGVVKKYLPLHKPRHINQDTLKSALAYCIQT